jgi:hypothetical protein
MTKRKNPNVERRAKRLAEISREYGLSVPFLRLEIRRGRLRAAKLGRAVVVPVEAIREWLESGMKGTVGAMLESAEPDAKNPLRH